MRLNLFSVSHFPHSALTFSEESYLPEILTKINVLLPSTFPLCHAVVLLLAKAELVSVRMRISFWNFVTIDRL
ncbi:Sulfite reductase [NADPH] hemoprotein beta-component [Trichinella pseudospiralis]